MIRLITLVIALVASVESLLANNYQRQPVLQHDVPLVAPSHSVSCLLSVTSRRDTFVRCETSRWREKREKYLPIFSYRRVGINNKTNNTTTTTNNNNNKGTMLRIKRTRRDLTAIAIALSIWLRGLQQLPCTLEFNVAHAATATATTAAAANSGVIIKFRGAKVSAGTAGKFDSSTDSGQTKEILMPVAFPKRSKTSDLTLTKRKSNRLKKKIATATVAGILVLIPVSKMLEGHRGNNGEHDSDDKRLVTQDNFEASILREDERPMKQFASMERSTLSEDKKSLIEPLEEGTQRSAAYADNPAANDNSGTKANENSINGSEVLFTTITVVTGVISYIFSYRMFFPPSPL